MILCENERQTEIFGVSVAPFPRQHGKSADLTGFWPAALHVSPATAGRRRGKRKRGAVE